MMSLRVMNSTSPGQQQSPPPDPTGQHIPSDSTPGQQAGGTPNVDPPLVT